MEGRFLLAHFDCGEAADALVGAVERTDELLLIIMRDVKLEAEAHAVALHCALPYPFGAGDCIRWLSFAGPSSLASST